jgi:hypothetical protein
VKKLVLLAVGAILLLGVVALVAVLIASSGGESASTRSSAPVEPPGHGTAVPPAFR